MNVPKKKDKWVGKKGGKQLSRGRNTTKKKEKKIETKIIVEPWDSDSSDVDDYLEEHKQLAQIDEIKNLKKLILRVNPKSKYRQTLITLDTSKRDLRVSTQFTHVWNINFSGVVDNNSINMIPIKNIVGIRFFDPTLVLESFDPDLPGVNKEYHLLIKEFKNQSFRVNTSKDQLNYHFTLHKRVTGHRDRVTWDQRVLNMGNFWFNEKYNVMPSTLSLEFFAHYRKLVFPGWTLKINQVITGVTTEIRFSSVSGSLPNTVGKTILLFDLRTDNIADEGLVQQMNSIQGHTVLTQVFNSRITIDFDSTSILGSFTLNETVAAFIDLAFVPSYYTFIFVHERD